MGRRERTADRKFKKLINEEQRLKYDIDMAKKDSEMQTVNENKITHTK